MMTSSPLQMQKQGRRAKRRTRPVGELHEGGQMDANDMLY